MSQLEDFLQNKPLNERLARLRAGEDEDEPAPPVAGPVLVRPGRDGREMDDDDREHLRRLRLEPGYPVLLRMLDRRLQFQEDAVKRASKDNPFAPAVPGMWAEVKALEAVRSSIDHMIETEVRILEENERQAESEDALLGK